MAGATKLLTAGGGGVILTPASSIASDVTVNLPVTGVNNGTLVCSDSSGNVGIGTSSPAMKLQVSGASPRIWLTDTTASGSNGELACDTAAFGIFNRSNLPMTFGTNNTERMRIDSSGVVIVGNTSASSSSNKFEAWYSSATQTGIAVRNTSTTYNGAAINFVNSNNTPAGYINQTGLTTVAYATSSDYRLKENIQPMQNALATVQQLNPVTYTWKADGSDGQGFIAHELQAVVPDCVTGEKDAVDAEGNPVYQGIDTSFLVATLTKAIQELSAKNDALEARITALEAK